MSKIIFISYNRRSRATAENLARDIEALGHEVWFDQELSGGQVWWEQILAKVRGCDVFVFVLDPESLNSTACKREFGYAANLNKPILPVLAADGVSTNLLPPELSQIQFIDYRKQDHRDSVVGLARALNRIPASNPLPDPLPAPPEVPLSYLGGLGQQIDSASPLSYEQQIALMADLRRSLRDPEAVGDTRILLDRLRRRPDLYATIAEEIDEVRQADPSPPPPQPQWRRLIPSKRSLLRALVIVLGLIVARVLWNIVQRNDSERYDAWQDSVAPAEKTAAEKTAAEKTAAEMTAAEKTAAEKTAAEKTAAEKTAAEKTAAEKTAAEKTAAEKTAAEKTAAEKTAAEKTAAEKTAAEKTAAEKTAAESAAAVTPPRPRYTGPMGPLEPGISYYDGDLYDRPAGTPEACVQFCANDDRCRAVTFIISQNRCWIKHSVYQPQQSPDMVSARKQP